MKRQATASTALDFGPPAVYGWLPGAQTVYGSSTEVHQVPAGFVHQRVGPDVMGAYAKQVRGWESIVWRWGDTVRADSITQTPGPTGDPAYRMEIQPTDEAPEGTKTSPRAELYSLDPEQKRRGMPFSPAAALRDGDEYWATFAFRVAQDFPATHWWATLFQRKIDDRHAEPRVFEWCSINVHHDVVDIRVPGTVKDDDRWIGDLDDFRDSWVQITIHERLSSGADGLTECYVGSERRVKVEDRPNVPTGDVAFQFQYGYYRSNLPKPNSGDSPPGRGVVEYTPLMILWGGLRTPVPSLL